MNEQRDPDLYTRVQRGDRQALEQLYDKYEKILYSFSYRMTSHKESAEEVVQEVFIKIWKGQGNFNASKGKFSSWVLTIARNTSIDLMRKRKEPAYELEERDALQNDDPSTEDLVEWKEQGSELRSAITSLAAEQQEMIESFYFKGATQREIAEQFDLPLGTVKGRIRLALRHLQKALRDKGGSSDGE